MLQLIILVVGDTAEKSWNLVAALIQNNKHSRVDHLENKFTCIVLENFPTTHAIVTASNK